MSRDGKFLYFLYSRICIQVSLMIIVVKINFKINFKIVSNVQNLGALGFKYLCQYICVFMTVMNFHSTQKVTQLDRK